MPVDTIFRVVLSLFDSDTMLFSPGPASLPGVDLKAIPIYDYVTCYWSFAAAKETVHAAHVCVVPLLAGARKVEYVYLEIDSINEEFDVSEFDPLVFTCGKDVLMLVVFRCEEKQQKLILGSHFIRGENRLMILAFEKVTEELENLVKELLIHVIRQASSSLELVLVTDFAQLNLEAMEHKSDVQLILPKFCTFMDKCFIWSCIAHHTILQGGRLDSLINLSPACVSVLPFKYMHILSERVSTISNAEFLNYSQSLLGHDQKELFSAWHSRIMCKLESDADAYNRQFERYTLRGSETKKTKPEGERPNAFQPEKIGAQYMRIHLASKQGFFIWFCSFPFFFLPLTFCVYTDEFVTIGLPIELFADCSMKQLESLSDWRSKNKQDVFVQTPSREISVDLYRNEHKKRAQQVRDGKKKWSVLSFSLHCFFFEPTDKNKFYHWKEHTRSRV